MSGPCINFSCLNFEKAPRLALDVTSVTIIGCTIRHNPFHSRLLSFYDTTTEALVGRRHSSARARGICFSLFCLRDGDLFCERICAFLGDKAAQEEIIRQEIIWRGNKEDGDKKDKDDRRLRNAKVQRD